LGDSSLPSQKLKRPKGKHVKADQSPLISTKKRRNSDFISDAFSELKQLNRKAHSKGSSDSLADIDSKHSSNRKDEMFLPQLVGGKSMLKESDIHNIVKALPISQQMYDW
jgi:hypothetical protein